MKQDVHYQLIAGHYRDRRAQGSGELYLRHINQGLLVLGALGSDLSCKRAYCLHPLLQADSDLASFMDPNGHSSQYFAELDPRALVLALEYRRCANSFLSYQAATAIDDHDIHRSPLADVDLMLIADKVQNRHDFEKNLQHRHPRSAELQRYFSIWLRHLGVSESRYQELSAMLH